MTTSRLVFIIVVLLVLVIALIVSKIIGILLIIAMGGLWYTFKKPLQRFWNILG